ncbi:MAG TPA: TIGR00725 family protein [Mycobacteriales bacterium]|jgi:uncharacterized protein (TIGR00725 family)|nr:TIGR00725 family protein [Mycobacteriales bacterium]
MTAVRRPPSVAVIGPGDTTDPVLLADAEAVGAGLARAGAVVVTGGLGGVMAAASRGARSAGGRVVAVLPGGDPAEANEWADVAIATGLGQARNLLVVRGARVVVAVGGSWGTLAEVALARRLRVPVVSLRGWAVQGPPPDDDVVAVGDAEAAIRAAASWLSSSPA